jgi:hypothetical protein
MTNGPFQLLVDGASINAISATNGTWTATTATIFAGGTGSNGTSATPWNAGTIAFPHGLQVGASIAIFGVPGAAGTAVNNSLGSTLYTVASVPSGTAFTFVAGTASFGTAFGAGSAGFAQDLLNPLINYTGNNRNFAVYATPGDVHIESSGDGASSSLSFTVYQDVSPNGTASSNTGPWYSSLPDNARVRFIDTTAGSGNYVSFLGLITNLDVSMQGSGLGTRTSITVSDSNALIDRTIFRKAKAVSAVKGQLAGSKTWFAGTSERTVITDILASVNSSKSVDYSFQRLFNTADTSGVYTAGTAYAIASKQKLEITLGTLRNALDSAVEFFQAQDGYARRYWVDSNATLRYEQVNAASLTYANAPFAITTAASDSPDNSGGAVSTINPRDINISYDSSGLAKRSYFLTADSGDSDSNPDPYVRVYLDPNLKVAGGTALARPGAILESVVDAPTIRGSSRTIPINNFASAYFLERAKPVFSGQIVIRGAGSQSWNQYGFWSGYYQTGPLTFARTTWQPGQWVSITAPQFGLTSSEFYRVEQVSVSFEPGSLQRIISITFARRRTGQLARLLAGLK